MISFDLAFKLTMQAIQPLPAEWVPLDGASGHVLAQDMVSRVNSPSVNASLKDGYAICSADIAEATPDTPVHLRLAGLVAAGGRWEGTVTPGAAVRILTGAPMPAGAEAVVSNEFASDDGVTVTVWKHAEPGRNVLPLGSDVRAGATIVAAGSVLRPTTLGLLAAAGFAQAPVLRFPRVALIATGDEIVAPSMPLPEGGLYASNLVTLAAWCRHYGMPSATEVVPDDRDSIRRELLAQIEVHDALITCGGAWTGDRDLVVGLLDELGWNRRYHRVRLGPGKGVAFGVWRDKPVFCLPGGPPSNQMAFLQLALPGLRRLAGFETPALPRVMARLERSVGRQLDWTEGVHGRLLRRDTLVFSPMRMASRLQEMALTEGIVLVPEGVSSFPAGSVVPIQLFPGIDPGELAWEEE